MKELFKQYAAYNIWANQVLFDRIKQLSDDEINKGSSKQFFIYIQNNTTHVGCRRGLVEAP
ncbi:MAG: hypothetical protein IPP48_03565 [Chitinophagaceae bacterium]|nr:hypothetical protein [Chitinophagaceae bacterium]